MAKIYNPPAELKVPSLSLGLGVDVSKAIQEIREAEKKFVEDLKGWLVKRNPNDKLAGEVIKFPVADGYAMYMVAATKPLALVHLPLGDAWSFEYAHRLTKKDVVAKIEGEKRLAELFSKKS